MKKAEKEEDFLDAVIEAKFQYAVDKYDFLITLLIPEGEEES